MMASKTQNTLVLTPAILDIQMHTKKYTPGPEYVFSLLVYNPQHSSQAPVMKAL